MFCYLKGLLQTKYFYQWNHIYLMESNEIQTSVTILHQENTDDKECLTLNA